jgi:hypothetical protein
LFLSTDASASNLRMIARETSYGGGARVWSGRAADTQNYLIRSDTFVDPSTGLTNFANGIPLVKGQKYFMMAAHHEGGGGDYLCINAKLIGDPDPGDRTPSIITGANVGFYAAKCSYVTFTTQPQSVTVNNYVSASFAAGGVTDSTTPVGPNTDPRTSTNNFLFFQWYKNGTPVAGATTSALKFPVVMPADNGSQIFCAMRALGYGDNNGSPLWATSSVATLTVSAVAPHLVYEGFWTDYNYTNFGALPTNYITLAFDSPMDPTALSQMSSYSVGGGLTLLGVIVNSNDFRSVNLAVTGTAPPGTVTITGALNGAGGGLALASPNTLPVVATKLMNVDIGVSGQDPALPSMMYVMGANAYAIAAEGSDIWNNADGFNFAYEMKTGDFDIVVRQKSITHTSQWAKGGLMVRETLDAGSRNWNIVNDPDAADGIAAPDGSGYGASAVECNCRNMTNGASGGWQVVTNGMVPAYPNAWVRLKRTGETLAAYYSTDGVTWVQHAYADPRTAGDSNALPATVYIGICTTAHNNDTPGTPPELAQYINTSVYADYNSTYVAVVRPVLTVTRQGGSLSISWTPAGGHLESSPAVSGTGVNWQTVGTANPATVTIGTGAMFFRVVSP